MPLPGKEIPAQSNVADSDYAHDTDAPGFRFGVHGSPRRALWFELIATRRVSDCYDTRSRNSRPRLCITFSRGLEGQMVKTLKDRPVLALATAQAWAEWLKGNHATSRGVWLKI